MRGWNARAIKAAGAKVQCAGSDLEPSADTRKNAKKRRGNAHKAKAFLSPPYFRKPVVLHYIVFGYTEPDTDGYCFKWFRDALTTSGIFEDDSPTFCKGSTVEFHKIPRSEEERFEMIVKEAE